MTRVTWAGMAALLLLGACSAETGPPDTSRGSADSPNTMLVDQMRRSAQGENFGGAMRPIDAQGGQKR